MSLGSKQEDFMVALGKLLVYAHAKGYRFRGGDLFRDPRVHGEHGTKNGYGASESVHKLKLAIDLNLVVDGKYITSSDHPAWAELHEYWESLGGAKAVPNDANHFSFEMWGCR